MTKQLLKNNIYNTIIVGASDAGLSYLEKNLTANIGFISKSYPENIKTIDGVDYFIDNVEYASFNHGLITLELTNGKLLLCTHLVIATETTPIKNHILTNFYYKYPHKEIAKDDIIVVVGHSNKAGQLATDIAKKCKLVYFIDKNIKTQYEPGIRLKIANKKNLQHLTNTNVSNLIQISTTYKIELDNFDAIICNDIYWLDDKLPDSFPTVNGFLEKDQDNYILVNKDNQTTIIPTVYAVGNCCKKIEEE